MTRLDPLPSCYIFTGCVVSKAWYCCLLLLLLLLLARPLLDHQSALEEWDSTGWQASASRLSDDLLKRRRNQITEQSKGKQAIHLQREANHSMRSQSDQMQKRAKLCSFFDPLINKTSPIMCGAKSFVSIVRSRCKTRLGNQLSSYAAVRYFQERYGMTPLMDPFQMRIIKSVFNDSMLTVKSLNMQTCCQGRRWKSVMAFKQDKRTEVATGLSDKFNKNPDYYSRNFMVYLGKHTMPVFLFKDILPQLRSEFIFRARIANLASNMIRAVSRRHAEFKKLIFVGLHARRGDRIKKWKAKKMFKDTIVGTYEGKFFNRAMDIFRNRYNTPHQKVVFLPTSDNYFWIKKYLINKNDTYFTRELIKETRVALLTRTEIGQMWHKPNLAVKGSISYGVDLAVLSSCNHTVLDYGTFGLWAGLLAGGRIVLPSGYSNVNSPDMVWWEKAKLPNVEYIDVSELNIGPPSET